MDCHDRFPLLLEAIFPPPVRLAGDINAKVDTGELLESVKSEWTKLWPLIDLKVAREPQGPRTENLGTPAYPLAQAGLEALAAAGRHPSVVPPLRRGPIEARPVLRFQRPLAVSLAAGSGAWAAHAPVGWQAPTCPT